LLRYARNDTFRPFFHDHPVLNLGHWLLDIIWLLVLDYWLFVLEAKMDLVTGGTGFIGSTLAKRQLDLGDEVATFDIQSSSRILEPYGRRWTHLQGNLGNMGEVLTDVPL